MEDDLAYVTRVAEAHLPADVAPVWLGLLRPAALLVREWDLEGPRVARIGGLPSLPPSLAWPLDDEGLPLRYVAELDCGALAAYPLDVVLPRDGRLLFFGDDLYDGGTGWHVTHVPLRATVEPRMPPEEGLTFAEGGFTARPVLSYPRAHDHPALRAVFLPPGAPRDGLRGHPVVADALLDALDDRRPSTWHQVGGYPAAVQGPVEEEAVLESRGAECYDDDAAIESLAWTCLLQVDTDDSLDLMWGDGGTAYWLARGDTSRLLYTVQGH